MEKDNNELMNISENENLDGTRALSISDISDDFINSKYNDGSFMKSGPKWFYNGIVMYPAGTYIVDGETVSLT